LEEERRLFYVAITRAEKHCILTCAQNRFRYGRMEYDTPSRFIRDIDPKLLKVESVASEGKVTGDDFGSSQLPWKQRSQDYSGYSSSRWMQNPNPVATQFRADPKPRVVAPRAPEKPVDPFSDSFKRQLNQASGGRFRSVEQASSVASPTASSLREGIVIEHQRFGIGTVIKMEGTGDNEKATVEFRNVGTKQLLLKFAKFKVVK
jgi:DNA helicase-2/ATP-dependent DNA helicase PcrA